jgi:hypothetical protein
MLLFDEELEGLMVVAADVFEDGTVLGDNQGVNDADVFVYKVDNAIGGA